jgi:hypothetical protein
VTCPARCTRAGRRARRAHPMWPGCTPARGRPRGRTRPRSPRSSAPGIARRSDEAEREQRRAGDRWCRCKSVGPGAGRWQRSRGRPSRPHGDPADDEEAQHEHQREERDLEDEAARPRRARG